MGVWRKPVNPQPGEVCLPAALIPVGAEPAAGAALPGRCSGIGNPLGRGRFPLWFHGAETDPPGAKLDPISPVPKKVDVNKAGELAAAGLDFGVCGGGNRDHFVTLVFLLPIPISL